MNYKESLAYIHSTPKFARVLGNDMLRKLLKNMGDPQDDLRFVHIAGTNGKGSAALLISSALTAAGYKTGLFTSPYIERFNERIRIDGREITDDELAEEATYVRNIIETAQAPVSEFALDTAIAFDYFRRQGCDIVVLEVGMGGRLDATNVIKRAEVSVIMSVSFDHTQYLGNTLTEIASEKCGIIKPGGDVAVYPLQKDEVWALIRRTCEKQAAMLHIAELPERTDGGFNLGGKSYALGFKGEYQIYNAAAAICAIDVLRQNGFDIPVDAVKSAFAAASWPARFEFFGDNMVIDGAHNPDGAKALVSSLKTLKRPVVLLTAMMSDKNVAECVQTLSPSAIAVVATEVAMERSLPAEDLAALFRGNGATQVFVQPDTEAALKKARKLADENNAVLCVCGSLYLAGEIRRRLK